MRDFTLPPGLEAHEPPARRDGVRLLAGTPDGVSHRPFSALPELLRPGDLLVVNTSQTLPAAVRLDRLALHFSGPLPSSPEGAWLVELRLRRDGATVPYDGGRCGEWFPLPGGATLTLCGRETPRLWRARLDTDVVAYLRRHGVPIRYSYVGRDWPLSAYQTVFGRPGPDGGSAEMPSAGRPFTPELVTRLVSRGVQVAPLSLHTGVASPEKDEPPYAERYHVPAATAALVNHVRWEGGRVIAVGTTVVRALETAAGAGGFVRPSKGWTSHVVTPDEGVRAVDGLLTGLHEPRSSHLRMLSAVAGEELLERVYEEALAREYRWHEFGDVNLLIR
ncbi:S-adenosylmethionine:tRNA ribosyltransferase-isomerase [Actinomadura sp. DC4]|uniref:S-adenosylmethionine:tRNA ribosyltransferase-isomerase n=1 Tax=Actinomadura sp. DC4 TaxID=3055069 RepID=UPI0025B1DC72|nr:S-adenosylmethionine:tRNA ribosyltransferase-isomerase [Actinomadura sp. DC4]MDN3354565.1 S-adenosylmethionine:tRNA ribosyltransferase-isomerase [Actinomadura sp. DC4]